MASVPKEFNIQEDIHSVSREDKIKVLQEGMVQKIDDETLKELMGALEYNLGELEENLRLLNSAHSVEDLKSCDIELKENNFRNFNISQVVGAKKRERLERLSNCFNILEKCFFELKDFRNKLMSQPKHVLNDLYKNEQLKSLFQHASNILRELLFTPQMFNPNVQELMQPLIDFLYLFNKLDTATTPYILQAFEKVKRVFKETHKMCESEWDTFNEKLVGLANDISIKKEFFNRDVEILLNGLMAKEIFNEFEKKINKFDKSKIEAILGELAYIKILSKDDFKKILKELLWEDIITESEKKRLETDLFDLFKKSGTDRSKDRAAKDLILNALKEKYLGDLKKAYFTAFVISQLLKLKIEKYKDGTAKLCGDGSLDKVDECIAYLVNNYFPSKADRVPYYSSRANPKNSEIEVITHDITKLKIEVQISFNRSVNIEEDSDTPKTYIDQLERCKSKDDGIVDLKKLFFTLFADYNKGGIFLLTHPLRHHRDRVDEIYERVVSMAQKGEVIDWHGVLIALEQWPDNKSLADQGSLKKRIHFFRAVIEQIDGIQKAPVAGPSHSLSY